MATNSEGAGPGALAVRLVGVGLLVASIPGCGQQPQISPAHREIVLRLATATSNHDPGLLDRTAAEIDRLAADGGLDDGEKGAFESIVAAARSNDWDRAQTLAYDLRDGQHPTAEDRERLANRTVRKPKTPPGKRPTTPP